MLLKWDEAGKVYVPNARQSAGFCHKKLSINL